MRNKTITTGRTQKTIQGIALQSERAATGQARRKMVKMRKFFIGAKSERNNNVVTLTQTAFATN